MASRPGKSDLIKVVFWTRPEKPRLYNLSVPGVDDAGNLRPRVRGRRTKEIKAVMPVVQPKVENLHPHNPRIAAVAKTHGVPDKGLCAGVSDCVTAEGASLRDLCVEDKKRVASLIRELARLGEEKENAEKNLKEERVRYQEQIMSLVEQQEQIIRESEAQKMLLDYQASLLKLHHQPQQQQQVLEQQSEKQSQSEDDKFAKSAFKVIHDSNPVTSTRYREEVKAQKMLLDYQASLLKLHHQPQQQQQVLEQQSEKQSQSEDDKFAKSAFKVIHDSNPVTSTRYREEVKDGIGGGLSRQDLSDKSEVGIGGCSTQVQLSFTQSTFPDDLQLHPHRPFTALIDRQLACQKQVLAVTAESLKCLPPESRKCLPPATVPASPRFELDEVETEDVIGERAVSTKETSAQEQLCSHGPTENFASKQCQTSRVSSPRQTCPGQTSRVSDRPIFVSSTSTDFDVLGPGRLSVEKNELIARLMQSQAEVLKSVQESDLERPLRESSKESPATELNTVRVDVATSTTQNSMKVKRKKKAKAVPPCYRPVLAPIMSSTQRSSEFGDFVRSFSDDGQQHQRDVAVGDVKHREAKLETEEVNRNLHIRIVDQEEEKAVMPGQETEAKFSQGFFHERKGDSLEVLDMDKYRQMSAKERKSELLKQRAVLLEEQAKLRKILAEQEDQLRVSAIFDHKMKEQLVLSSSRDKNSQKSETANTQKSGVELQEATKQDLARRTSREEQVQAILAHDDRSGIEQKLSPLPVSTASPALITSRLQDEGQTETAEVCDDTVRAALPIKSIASQGYSKEPRLATLGKAKIAAVEEDELSHVQEEDGGVQVTCTKQKVKDVVRKLNYSIHSDTENETAVKPGHVSIPANQNEVHVSCRQLSSPHAVDIDTNMSYVNTDQSKTLSVEEIIKTLSGPIPVSGLRGLGQGQHSDISKARSLDQNFTYSGKDFRAAKFDSVLQSRQSGCDKTASVFADRNTRQFSSSSPLGSSVVSHDQDPVLELFELKRMSRSSSSMAAGSRDGGGDRGDADRGGGVVRQSRSLIDSGAEKSTILTRSHDVDIGKNSQRKRLAFGGNGCDSFEEYSLVKDLIRNMDDLKVSGSDNLRASGSDNLRASGSDKLRVSGSDNLRASGLKGLRVTGLEAEGVVDFEEEESQILEDIFFVV